MVACVQVRLELVPGPNERALVGLAFLTVLWVQCGTAPTVVPIALAGNQCSSDQGLEWTRHQAEHVTAVKTVLAAHNLPCTNLDSVKNDIEQACHRWAELRRPATPITCSSTIDGHGEDEERTESEAADIAASLLQPACSQRPSTGAKRARQIYDLRGPQSSALTSLSVCGDPLPPTSFSEPQVTVADDISAALDHLDVTYVPLRIETEGRTATVTRMIRLKEPTSPMRSVKSVSSAHLPINQSKGHSLSNIPSDWSLGSLSPTLQAQRGRSQAQCFKMHGKWCVCPQTQLAPFAFQLAWA